MLLNLFFAIFFTVLTIVGIKLALFNSLNKRKDIMILLATSVVCAFFAALNWICVENLW
jgi:hypothetical protein